MGNQVRFELVNWYKKLRIICNSCVQSQYFFIVKLNKISNSG